MPANGHADADAATLELEEGHLGEQPRKGAFADSNRRRHSRWRVRRSVSVSPNRETESPVDTAGSSPLLFVSQMLRHGVCIFIPCYNDAHFLTQE